MFRFVKTPVAVGWIALAVLLVAVAVWVNGGFGLGRSALASGLVILALLGSSAVAGGLLRMPTLQRSMLRADVKLEEARGPTRFVALFCGGLGLGLLVDALLRYF